MSHNNSYVSNSITYNYRVGSTSKAKNYRYGEAFKEKTTRSEGISCNSYANCYIGCSCASGWTQGTAPSSGEYVWATDNRYTGVNSLSVGSGLNASGTIDAQSASSGISASGLGADSGAGISAKSSGSGNYSVSTMGTSGGMTCYKKACPDGYYLDAPNSTYFEYTTSTGPVELTCYKATGCKDGYYNGGSSYNYHEYMCSRCTYSCPSGYSTSTTSSSCKGGYTFESTSAITQNGCAPQTCGKCEKKYYDPVTVYVNADLSYSGYRIDGISYTASIGLGNIESMRCDYPDYPLKCEGVSFELSPGDYRVTLNMHSARIIKNGSPGVGLWSALVNVRCRAMNLNSGGKFTITGDTPSVFLNFSCSQEF